MHNLQFPVYQSFKQVRAVQILHVNTQRVDAQNPYPDSFIDSPTGEKGQNRDYFARVSFIVDDVLGQTHLTGDFLDRYAVRNGGYLVKDDNGKLSYYPKRVFDESYLKLDSINVTEPAFALLNPKLQGLDPFDASLTKEQKAAIINECKLNPWYFFQNVLREPKETPEQKEKRLTEYLLDMERAMVKWDPLEHQHDVPDAEVEPLYIKTSLLRHLKAEWLKKNS